MKINVSKIFKETGAKEDFSFEMPNMSAERLSGSEITIADPVKVSGTLMDIGNQMLELNARVQAKVISACSRCLDEVAVKLDFQFTEKYRRENDATDNWNEPEDDEAAILTYSGDVIDLDPAVRDNILLNLPMQFFCRPDCPGLCPTCGRNLKEGPCRCKSVDVDPRLAVLAQLKIKKDEL